MKYVVTLISSVLLSAVSFAEEPLERSEREMAEVIVTAEKITESAEKPQLEEEEVQGVILADLSIRLSEAQKQI